MPENGVPNRETRAKSSLFHGITEVSQHIVQRRFGWATFWLLVLWIPLCQLIPIDAIVGNAFLLENYGQLLLLTTLNVVALVFCVSLLRVMNSRFATTGYLQRVGSLIGNGDSPWGKRQFLIVIVSALLSPTILAWRYSSEFDLSVVGNSHLLGASVAIVSGMILAYVILRSLGWAKSQLIGSKQEIRNYLPFEAVDSEGHLGKLRSFQGFLGRFGWEGIDLQLLIYTCMLIAMQWGITRYFPDASQRSTSAPLVAILLIWIVGMSLCGLSFWLDKFRIPVLPALLAMMLLLRCVGFLGKDATLATVPDNSKIHFTSIISEIRKAEEIALLDSSSRPAAVINASAELEEIAWQAIVKRMSRVEGNNPKRGKTLVIVTCPGGGIHAAAWSSYVLDAISRDYPKFRESIGIISGVSGGSVGTLNFVSTAYSDGPSGGPLEPKPLSAFELSSSSSLEPIAFGMMTDDFYGTFIPRMSLNDRGQRLEDSLHARLPPSQQQQTLGDWGDRACNGEMPIVVFNATEAVTGRRVLFDSVPTPLRRSNVGLTSRPFNYRELLEYDPTSKSGVDIRPVTAARTSASFPYVSPFVRPDAPSIVGQHVAMGDGGYVDNEGIVTAVDWIEFLLRRWSATPKKDRPFQRILLLRITPVSSGDSLDPPSSHWLFRNLRPLTGPLETMASVRSTSQSERGNLESDLAALYLVEANSPVAEVEIKRKPDKNIQERLFQAIGPQDALGPKVNQARETAARERFLRKRPASGASSKSQAEAPGKFGAMIGGEVESELDLPVVVKEIPFETGGDDLMIPLNWKLTREQKKWYPIAWDWNITQDEELTQLLNECFSKATKP